MVSMEVLRTKGRMYKCGEVTLYSYRGRVYFEKDSQLRKEAISLKLGAKVDINLELALYILLKGHKVIKSRSIYQMLPSGSIDRCILHQGGTVFAYMYLLEEELEYFITAHDLQFYIDKADILAQKEAPTCHPV